MLRSTVRSVQRVESGYNPETSCDPIHNCIVNLDMPKNGTGMSQFVTLVIGVKTTS